MKKILLNQGKATLVDDEDYNRIINYRYGYAWYAQKCRNTYYATTHNINGLSTVRMHRIIIDAKPHEQVDHIDGDGLNNCKSNLRIVNASQQMMNRGKFKDKSSKYKGVSYYKANGRYQAHIRKNGYKKHLGYFKTEEEAALAYDVAVQELFGEYARLNFSWKETNVESQRT